MTTPLFDHVEFDNILRCVHCGLCLDACPTYRVLGTEQDSPRGRLYLMRGLWEGELLPDPQLVAPLDRCLDCRACETACPSKVPYGELLEKTRGVLTTRTQFGKRGRWLRTLAFRQLLPRGGRLRMLSVLAKIYRGLGLAKLVVAKPLRHVLPRFLVRAHRTMPQFDGRSFKRDHAGWHMPPTEPVGRVAFFSGCIMDVADTAIHAACLLLLRRAGYAVWVPKEQTCCGALAVHAGDRAAAAQCATSNTAVFAAEPTDALIVDSAGCGVQVSDAHHLFTAASKAAKDCRQLGEQVVDVLSFLNRDPAWIAAQQWRDDDETVLYDAPCHLVHAQRAGGTHLGLLQRIPFTRVVPLTDADRCCGAAGIYNLLQGAMADQILAAKLDDIEASLQRVPQAGVLLTGNPGCLYQLRAGVAQRGLPLRVIHPAHWLAQRLVTR